MKTLRLTAIQRMIEGKDGKRFDAAEKCMLSSQESDLLSFLRFWLVGAQQLVVSFVLLLPSSSLYRGDELIRVASNSTAATFSLVLKDGKAQGRQRKESGFLQPRSPAKLTPFDGAIDCDIRHVCICILVGFVAPLQDI